MSRRRWAAATLAGVLLAVLAFWLLRPAREHVLTVGVFSGSYWGTPNGSSYQVLDDAIRRFEDSHPGVEVRYVSGIGVSDYREWLAEQLLLGTAPDVYFVVPEDFELLVSAGALLPLDELVEQSGLEPQRFYPACWQEGQSAGRQYALPYESAPTVMFVNRTLLESYGIAMPDAAWTWEDFYSICARIADASQQKGERQFGVYGYTWQNALYANGAALFDPEGQTCYLADSRVVEAIQFQQRLDALNTDYRVTAKDFDLGLVAFRPFSFSEYRAYQPYPWRVKKYSSFEWDCLPMPAGPQGDNASELRTMLAGVNARTKQRRLAWEFLQLLCADEQTQSELFLQSQGISPLCSVAEDPELLARMFADASGGTVFNQQAIGEIMRSAVAVPRFPKQEQANAMAENAVSAALEQGESLSTYLQTAQREINITLQ